MSGSGGGEVVPTLRLDELHQATPHYLPPLCEHGWHRASACDRCIAEAIYQADDLAAGDAFSYARMARDFDDANVFDTALDVLEASPWYDPSLSALLTIPPRTGLRAARPRVCFVSDLRVCTAYGLPTGGWSVRSSPRATVDVWRCQHPWPWRVCAYSHPLSRVVVNRMFFVAPQDDGRTATILEGSQERVVWNPLGFDIVGHGSRQVAAIGMVARQFLYLGDRLLVRDLS